MNKIISKYFLFLLIGLSGLSVSLLVEQRYIENTDVQIEDKYKTAESIIHDKELQFVEVFQNQLRDTTNLRKKWVDLIDINNKNQIIIDIFKNDTLQLWTSNIINVKRLLSQLKPGISLINSSNGSYLVYFQPYGSYKFVLMYSLRTNYSYQNQYLENEWSNELSFLKDAVISPSPIKDFFDLKSRGGNYLFSLQIFYNQENDEPFIWSLIILFCIVSFISSNLLFRFYIRKNVVLTSIVFIGIAALIRYINIALHLPVFLYHLEMFKPQAYASSNLLGSLGDFLITVLLLLWYFLILEGVRSKPQSNKMGSILYAVCFSMVSILAADSAFDSIRSLVFDSQISFDFNNIYSIDSFTIIALLISVLVLLISFFATKNLYRFYINSYLSNPLKWIIFIFCLVFFQPLIIKYVFERGSYHLIETTILISVFFAFNYFGRKVNRFQYYFLLIICISFFSSVSIYRWNYIKEQENRKLFSNKLLSQNDITTDYYLKSIEHKLIDDKYIKYYFINPISLKSQFEKRLRLIYFTGHLSRYEISVFDFDTIGNHYKVRNPFSFKQLDYAYKNQTIPTIDNYFKYLKNGADLKGYLAKFPVKMGRQKLGYIFIQLQPKLIQEENRFDDLLIEGFRQTKKRKIDYSYAIYHDKNLVSQSGNFPYRVTSTWPTPNSQYLLTTQNKYNHLLFADKDQMLVVVSKPEDKLYAPLGLFSLEFTFFTLILIVMLAIYAAFNWRELKKFTFYNTIIFTKVRNLVNRLLLVKDPDVVLIRTRIQIAIVLIVFITLGVTAYFTISFISNQYNDKQNEKLMKKIHNVVNTIESENLSDLNTINRSDAEAFINQIADFYETDITIFNLNGEMVTSTTSKIYEDGVISHLMNANAFFHLNFLRESQFSQNEMIANFGYIGAYVPIFKNEKEVIGYIQLPYFNKQSDLLNEISSIIVGFINLYTALFIVIGFMAYLISTSISYPLILIQNQLKKTILGKNEPIKWKRKDEIGDLVVQYNLMIDKLAESANILAQSEREGAWRDIAKQIAHEIKNPLTPMKLSVQHLERTWNDKSPKLEDTFKRVTKTLITQIDILNDLASEFSSYAKMPDPVIENILLYNSLKSIADLYIGTDDAEILLVCPDDLYVSFDEGYLNRVITNLVKNGIQAVNDGENPSLEILVDTSLSDSVIIQIKDNGTGISDEKAGNIFTPYFSTKISGMGLGLPIVKNMVESCGGKIWFENNIDSGASFFVKLRKVDLE